MANNVEITILYDFYGDVLTEKQRDFLNYYYNDDLSLSEIAENEGITRQGVRDAIKRAEAQLYEMEEKLGFAAKFEHITESNTSVPSPDTLAAYNACFPCASFISRTAAAHRLTRSLNCEKDWFVMP